jgi:hypothetical protein
LKSRNFTIKKLKMKEKYFKMLVSKNLMKIYANSGLEKVDLKLKFIKREKVKLQIIIANTKDKSETVSKNTIILKINGV